MKKAKKWFVSVLLVLLCTNLLCGCDLHDTALYEPGSVNSGNANEYLNNIVAKIGYDTSRLVKGQVPAYQMQEPTLSCDEEEFMYELPDISEYPLDVAGIGEINVEIFVPFEDNGSAIRNAVKFVAECFNEKKYEVNGKVASVSIRSLEANLANEYILNEFYMPQGYIPSNELYGTLLSENGIDMNMICNSTVRNTIGLVIENSKYDELIKKYGRFDVSVFIEANRNGDISVGYTNPTNNPTGLNFVVSTLSYFDANNPSSIEATTDFSSFQNTVSTVSYSMQQMERALSTGTVDSFVIERQAYESDENLKENYTFFTYGLRHDNPLYSIGSISDEEVEVLKLFGESFNNQENSKFLENLGFNKDPRYESNVSEYSGGMLLSILEYWKNEKASGKKIVAVFVADQSGSMRGKIKALQDSLKNAMQYVGKSNKVGLISYNSAVHLRLPIKEFDVEQQEHYVGAVDELSSGGGTSTNNALLVAIKIIEDEKLVDDNIKPIIILLSDGYTENGYSLDSVSELITAFNIPVYTIGYDANVEELTKIADITGGTYIESTSNDIGYVLKTLFNAEI